MMAAMDISLKSKKRENRRNRRHTAGHGPQQFEIQQTHVPSRFDICIGSNLTSGTSFGSVFHCGINVKPNVLCVKTTTAVYLLMIL